MCKFHICHALAHARPSRMVSSTGGARCWPPALALLRMDNGGRVSPGHRSGISGACWAGPEGMGGARRGETPTAGGGESGFVLWGRRVASGGHLPSTYLVSLRRRAERCIHDYPPQLQGHPPWLSRRAVALGPVSLVRHVTFGDFPVCLFSCRTVVFVCLSALPWAHRVQGT